MAGEKRSTSPWVWIAVGCGGLVLLAGIVVVGLGVWGYRTAKQLESEMKNPETREARVLEVLGAKKLPEGYFPMVGLSAPFGLMETAILSDRLLPFDKAERDQIGSHEAFGERGFIYLMMIRTRGEEQELDDFFSGKTDDPRVLRKAGVNVSRGEVVRRGKIAAAGGSVRYLAQRSNVGFNSMSSSGNSLTNILLIHCEQDSKFRFGIWFGPDPAPQTPVAELEVSGTTADEAALVALLGHFDFCGAP